MSRSEQIRPVVLVTRATGRSGAHVLRRIAARGRFEVRAMSRTADAQSVRALAEQGVQVVVGDLDDVDVLRDAMAGCYGVVGYVRGDVRGRSWQRILNLIDASADAGIGYVVVGVRGSVLGSGSGAGGEVSRMEAYARSVGVPAAFVSWEGTRWVMSDVIAAAFECRVDGMLRAEA